MSLGAYAESTRSAMQSCINEKHLDKLVTIANPLDINPGADDEVHAHMAELMLNDEGIDAVVIGLDPHSPVTHYPCGDGRGGLPHGRARRHPRTALRRT